MVIIIDIVIAVFGIYMIAAGLKMKKTGKKVGALLLGAAMLLSAAGCHAPRGYHAFQSLPTDGWKRGDTLLFTLPRQTEPQHYHARIEVRHTGDFPYRSLWLVVSRNTVDSLTFRTDTIECVLTDPNGHFDGDGINNLYQKSFPLPDLTLPAGFTPTVKIAHHLQDRYLTGITDVGIRLY